MFGLEPHVLLLLGVCLLAACAFEFVNGFHDTANAVATVIYTNALRPWVAVVWSAFWNFIGVFAGGIGVAMGIVYLLPVESLVDQNVYHGIAMVGALILARHYLERGHLVLRHSGVQLARPYWLHSGRGHCVFAAARLQRRGRELEQGRRNGHCPAGGPAAGLCAHHRHDVPVQALCAQQSHFQGAAQAQAPAPLDSPAS